MSLKSMVKDAAATVVAASGGLRLLPNAHAPRIVMYHRVLSRANPEFGASHPGMVVGLDAFCMHVDEYAAHYRVVTVAEIVRQGGACSPGGLPMLAITFDDAWRDTLELALPVLAKRGLSATVFAAVDFAVSAESGKPFIRPGELRELGDAGHEVGCHSWSHRELPDVPDEELGRELLDSRRWLEDVVGRRVVTFAYPRGAYDERSVAIVRREYESAVTIRRGFCHSGVDRALLPRLGIHDDVSRTVSRLRWRLAGLP